MQGQPEGPFRRGPYPSRMPSRVPSASESGVSGGALPAELPAERRQAVTAATVLLIEDEPGIVDFVRRGLEAEGFAVEAAADGERRRAAGAQGRL